MTRNSQYNEVGEELETYKRPLKRLFVIILVAALIGIFIFWRLEGSRAEKLRSDAIDLLIPSIELGQIPSDMYFATIRFFQDMSRYRDSQATITSLQSDLKRWQTYALSLEEENTMLRKFVNFSPTVDFPTISASVLADTTSPFSHSVLLSSGTENGVMVGLPATDGVGIVGRVTNASRNSSRLLLITDSSSRIPVRVLPSGNRGIVHGDNTSLPQIDLINTSADIEAGDQIMTNGDGGVFPPDLAVGTVMKGSDGKLRVILSADLLNLQNVSLIIKEQAVIEEQSAEIVLNPETTNPAGAP
ncbi:MAG: rod shape-determining protein MreC [Rhodobacteraceae bacterium]|nr:rod shape-determining protein MreC [Paracoccaceae bacterium]